MEHDLIIINSYNETGQKCQVQIGPITKALRSQTGRAALAAAMANPIRRNLDYQSLARRAFLIDALPPGAMPTYDRSTDDLP